MAPVRMLRYVFKMTAPRKDPVKISVIAMDLKSGIRDALIQAHQVIPLGLDQRLIELHVQEIEEVRHG